MKNVLLVCALCAFAQEPADVDRLIRTLGSESTEAREKAQDQLVDLGEKALAALREAGNQSDAEIVRRAKVAIEDIERLAMEKKHDAEQRAALVKETGLTEDREKKPRGMIAWTDGARFNFYLRPYKGGLILTTLARGYLSKSIDEGRDFSFDVVGITDKDGKELAVDRCGRCSPGVVYAKETAGSIHPHLRGSQRWYSLYVLEFDDPKDGDRKKVGDFTIEVAWPTLKVTSRHPWAKEVFAKVGGGFRYEVKPGVSRPSLRGSMGAIAGGGGGGGGGGGDGWCRCKDGPQPIAATAAPELLRETILKQEPGYVHPLKDVAKIKVWFRKPIVEPIDLTPLLSSD